jgi:hypothetical protein
MTVKHELRRLVWKERFDVTPFDAMWSAVARRRDLLRTLGIDLVLDVGANVGQYASDLRRDAGFEGRIRSFKPTRDAFRTLDARASAGSEMVGVQPRARRCRGNRHHQRCGQLGK